MKALYDKVSGKICKQITRSYSTSFSIGINLLHHSIHLPIYSIYGFVRLADEIVDSFHDYNKQALLDQFERDTYTSIREGISLNPVLNAFQHTVNAYNIELDLISTFLHSMRMDLDDIEYDQAAFEKYILGSAEVVGLMCLQVFVEGDKQNYEKLKPAAMKLGAAFQKVNFLRDLGADYEKLGRSYFPNVDLSDLDENDKAKIEASIRSDFTEALVGIKALPKKAKLGVFTAYVYYLNLFRKIAKTPPREIMNKRIRISNFRKFLLLFKSYYLSQRSL
ncbi:MAG: phytoene/squalene synthase family protein [Saprospiraceae bacterium]|nr:phytoene/squalene synthase family protein [Saprospiraceae bacterium]